MKNPYIEEGELKITARDITLLPYTLDSDNQL